MPKVCVIATIIFLFCHQSAPANDAVRKSGDYLQIGLPAASAIMALSLKDYRGLLQLGESTAVAYAAKYALKQAIDERRPNGGKHSFPSGHTAIAFAAAEFTRKRYGWSYGAPAYVLASYVGYSRVQSREHYVHDVAAGAALGVVSSYIFTKPYQGWYANVSADSKSAMLTLSRKW